MSKLKILIWGDDPDELDVILIRGRLEDHSLDIGGRQGRRHGPKNAGGLSRS